MNNNITYLMYKLNMPLKPPPLKRQNASPVKEYQVSYTPSKL